jgi:uncharacterized protein
MSNRNHLVCKVLMVLFMYCFYGVHPAWGGWKKGREAFLVGEYPKAVKELRPLGEKGHKLSQYLLGVMYLGPGSSGYRFPSGYRFKADKDLGIKWLLKSSENGYRNAQYLLGRSYYSGDGVKKNYKEALNQFQMASDLGHQGAELMTGWMYLFGYGVKKDFQVASKWFRKSYMSHSEEVQHRDRTMRFLNNSFYAQLEGWDDIFFIMGQLRDFGRSIPLDRNIPASHHRRDAERGDVYAQSKLGWMYWYGQGVERDRKKGTEWYRKAAKNGSVTAPSALSRILSNKEVMKWTRKAAENGDAIAQNSLSSSLFFNKKESAKWTRKAAEQGNFWAQYSLAIEYGNNKGFLGRNDKLAFKWFRKAAEQGYLMAQYQLAYLYRYSDSTGVRRNYKLAAKWYRKAAERGHVAAQKDLGQLLSSKKGGRNYGEAYKWLRRSVEDVRYSKNTNAYFLYPFHSLGFIKYKGEGVLQDFIESHMWWNIGGALSPKCKSCINSRGIIENSMTPQQIAKAQRLAREWIERLNSRSSERSIRRQ